MVIQKIKQHSAATNNKHYVFNRTQSMLLLFVYTLYTKRMGLRRGEMYRMKEAIM